MIEMKQMNANHVGQVVALEKVCFADPWSEASIAGELGNPLSLWLVAMEQDAVLGYVGSQSVLGEGDMMNLAVTPAFRRQGIAEKLVLALCSALLEKNVRSLTLEVRASNQPAKALYEKLKARNITVDRLWDCYAIKQPDKVKRGTMVQLVEDGRKILTDCIASQVELHKLYGGVVPEIASRKHVEAISGLAEQAIQNAGISKKEIDAVAVTYAPGLIGAVLVGVNFAKATALALQKPLIPVHHIRGHIAANYLAYPELEPPFLCLMISGGHTMLIDVKGYTEMEILGTTLDDAAGECFDKVARVLGMPYPGGKALDAMAALGDAKKYALPRSKPGANPLDMSFSGLKTAAINLIHNARQKGEEIDVPSLCASFSAAASDNLVPRTVEALKRTGYRKLAVAGGVAANSRIRKDILQAASKLRAEVFMPPLSLCGDNGAMIGAQGYYEYLAGNVADQTLNAYATKSILGERL